MKARWPVRKRLAAVLAQAPGLSTVSVTTTAPMDPSVSAEHVWCSDASGSIQPGPYVSGRQENDDEFTVTIRVLTRRGRTHDECMERVSEIVSAIYDAIADGTDLIDFGVDGDWRVHECNAGESSDSPGTDQAEGFPFATAEVGVDFEVRYLGGTP